MNAIKEAWHPNGQTGGSSLCMANKYSPRVIYVPQLFLLLPFGRLAGQVVEHRS